MIPQNFIEKAFVRYRKENEMVSGTKTSMFEVNAGTLVGPIWFIGWLFTIGFAKLIWWQAILGLVVWPYFLGVAAR